MIVPPQMVTSIQRPQTIAVSCEASTLGLNHASSTTSRTLANAVSVACLRPYRYADITVGKV